MCAYVYTLQANIETDYLLNIKYLIIKYSITFYTQLSMIQWRTSSNLPFVNACKAPGDDPSKVNHCINSLSLASDWPRAYTPDLRYWRCLESHCSFIKAVYSWNITLSHEMSHILWFKSVTLCEYDALTIVWLCCNVLNNIDVLRNA